jgi:hypothetical protein
MKFWPLQAFVPNEPYFANLLMTPFFSLEKYLAAFDRIEGMFSPDAALMLMAYGQLAAANGITGDTMEIGVHHGLSAIEIAALRGPGRSFVAVDLFEEKQSINTSQSGSGNLDLFLRHMREFHGDVGFLRVFSEPSSGLQPERLGDTFSFCHIDGGHSALETFQDLVLCTKITLPGGLICLDDYFNPSFPEVSVGAAEFLRGHPELLKPVAIGFNKVLFQKSAPDLDINALFLAAFPLVPHASTMFCGAMTYLFDVGFRAFVDIGKSTFERLVPNRDFNVRAQIEPQADQIEAQTGQTVVLPVRVLNQSPIAFQKGLSPFGLSYHLLRDDGTLVQFDNKRSFFWNPLGPGEERIIPLQVQAPDKSGVYLLEIDIVWEGVTWFKAKNNPAPSCRMFVA